MFRTRFISTVAIFMIVSATLAAGSWTVSGTTGDLSDKQASAPGTDSVAAALEFMSHSARVRSEEVAELPLSVARRGHTATALTDGRVLVVGGENERGAVAEAEVIDTLSKTVSSGGSARVARTEHTATLLADGRVLIVGGSSKERWHSSTEIFDPATNSFSAGPRLRLARRGHTATALDDRRVLLAGGRNDGTAEILDAATGNSRLLQSKMAAPRRLHGALLLDDGSVLLAGGKGPDGKSLASAEVFDPTDLGFSPTLNWMHARRIRPDFKVLPDGKIQVIGGDGNGTMEMYHTKGRFFRSNVPLPMTSDILPAQAMLLSQTRAAFVDNKTGGIKKGSFRPESDASAEVASEPISEGRDYSSIEIPQLGKAIIAGSVDSRSRVVQSVLVSSSSPATVTTDRIEYLPEWSPVVSGSGWYPNERILIVRQQVRYERRRTILSAVADEQGNFENRNLTPADNKLGGYILTAIGERSGYVAQTSYRSAPPFDPKQAAESKAPQHIEFTIPLSGNGGSVKTAMGPLNWRFKQGSSAVTDNISSGDIPLPTGCINIGPIDFCNSAVRFEFLSGHFNMKAEVDGFVTFDPGCLDPTGLICDFRLPELDAGVFLDESLDVELMFRITGEGSISASGEILPLFPPIEFEIPNTDINGEIKAGLFAGVELALNDPLVIETGFKVKESVRLGVQGSTSDGIGGVFDVRNSEFSAPFRVIEMGETCLKLSLGAEASVSLNVEFAGIGVNGSLNGSLSGFVEGCVTPTSFTSDCLAFHATIDVGIEAGIGASIGASLPIVGEVGASVSLDEELLRFNLATFDATLLDASPPTITADNIVTTTSPGQCSSRIDFTPQARDSCSGLAQVVCNPPSGTTFAKGTSTINCTATDNKGNSASTSFTVTVNDQEAPSLGPLPASVIRPTDPGLCSAVVTYAAPSVSDNCPGANLACVPPSGMSFPKGVTTVTCTATDTSFNKKLASFSVTVLDQEKPKIAPPADLDANAAPGAMNGAVSFALPGATDNCPGVKVACNPPSGSVFSVGTTTVSCRATDEAGNTADSSFKVELYNIVVFDDASGTFLRAVWNGNGSARYEFYDCRKGITLTGTMAVTVSSCKIEGRDKGTDPKRPDRDIYILFNPCTLAGSGSVQIFTTGAKYNLNDSNLSGNALSCPDRE